MRFRFQIFLAAIVVLWRAIAGDSVWPSRGCDVKTKNSYTIWSCNVGKFRHFPVPFIVFPPLFYLNFGNFSSCRFSLHLAIWACLIRVQVIPHFSYISLFLLWYFAGIIHCNIFFVIFWRKFALYIFQFFAAMFVWWWSIVGDSVAVQWSPCREDPYSMWRQKGACH